MPNTLIFPDGVRLAAEHELPGPTALRAELWTRVQSASIAPGYVLQASDDARFSHYAEINVDAPKVWAVFRDLCAGLLAPDATLLFGGIDEEAGSLGSASVASLLALLEPHARQLSHDGYLQFGLVSGDADMLDEVFVTPTKFFKVWLNEPAGFRAVMRTHDLAEAAHLQFIDEFPRTTVALPRDSAAFGDAASFRHHLAEKIASLGRS